MKGTDSKMKAISMEFDEEQDYDLQYKVEEKELLFGVEFLMKEFYEGTFTESAKALQVEFTNGQKFEISVKELAQA